MYGCIEDWSGPEATMNADETSGEAVSLSEKNNRSERFMAILKRHQIPKHGAQTVMAKVIGVSEATIAAWMRGSLPRDPATLISFCDHYDVDLYWWVTGNARPRAEIALDLWMDALDKVNTFFRAREIEVPERQKMAITVQVYNQPANADEYLDTMSKVISY
jgi:transcriptional regulator with XRE-family HTH domain